ncbi:MULTISPECIES: Nramp family divalent metal transporter [Mammaliicoccus]|uniref:Divalent metal cation transporter MntH n=1 Tax=Mammaliicoccus sciuri TaxID=1296 RepID=A0AB37HUA9_MAMSC|nr:MULTISPECIES: Nramp family divalent metal transporter [Mammaliicoccus]MCD8796856.1 Nramp family divalent metal transporter [Mammaliicoccus sciuri]MCD8799343.1 Nramp family divalent metal transporter [Mammaliicoccus sciuri]MCE4980982.1 Nramp family divalent metal transporter [Mammaliicoccus sciuri]MCE5057677.1 Nramp family divalent metal transporter [Mammaliicoccus sciuri]MCE5085845.1 Nramp family divalent metal transporter [Mammaliicoccus sciuri]
MGKSLEEINSTVSFDAEANAFRKFLMYLGPGLLVAVGYMDPGNWITSMSGGAQYGYILLFVILISSLSAMLLQSMCARLGIASGMDLAQVTEHMTNKSLGVFAWILAELAIMATDIAEVIGSAIALNLLFNIPLTLGVTITVLDVLLLLLIIKLGFRKIEAIVGVLIFTVLIIFMFEVYLSSPDASSLMAGFLPSSEIVTNKGALYIALGIIGATIMPHNLYLHSSIVQSRNYERTDKGKKSAIKYATIDSNIQLTIAFIINCLLLVLGAALFFGSHEALGRFFDLYDALSHSHVGGAIGGAVMSTLFAIALLASGQNSTITGTLSGQIVMEGFLKIKLKPWVRRIITRVIAVIPVFLCLWLYGSSDTKIEDLLIFTQVFLSLALPFSIIPLIMATSNPNIMGKQFVNKRWVNIISWILAVVLSVLNIYLIVETISEFM